MIVFKSLAVCLMLVSISQGMFFLNYWRNFIKLLNFDFLGLKRFLKFKKNALKTFLTKFFKKFDFRKTTRNAQRLHHINVYIDRCEINFKLTPNTGCLNTGCPNTGCPNTGCPNKHGNWVTHLKLPLLRQCNLFVYIVLY